ncbi:MAG TPA: diadenylate cyclase CdaA [Bacteroidales bacterium]|nr:diadenylate cyclase CdaA [Bacteroidales bacterium]
MWNILGQLLHLSITDIIDIVLVAWIIYEFYMLIRGTIAFTVFLGIILIVVIYQVVNIFHLPMFSAFLGQFISAGIIMLIIVFQNEIKRFLSMIGTPLGKTRIFNQNERKRFLFFKLPNYDFSEKANEIIEAALHLSHEGFGALIAIEKNTVLQDIISTGIIINAEVNRKLIETIFYKNTPMHDGGMIIRKNTIVAARTIFPLAEETQFNDLYPSLGTRHRAAIGLSEQSDAVIIVVSEQNGAISIAYQGVLYYNLNTIEFQNKLLSFI